MTGPWKDMAILWLSVTGSKKIGLKSVITMGGTYHEPRYHRYRTESKNRFNQRKEYYENEKNQEQQTSQQTSQQKSEQTSEQKSQESEKKFAKTYLES